MPVSVEVLAYVPTQFYHCAHCEVVWHELGVGQRIHREQLDAGIPDDLYDEYLRLSHWVAGMAERYGDRLSVTLVDPASLEGFYKSLRHCARAYPAIVIDGRETVNGGDLERAEALVAARLSASAEHHKGGGDA